MQNYIYRCEQCRATLEVPKEFMSSSCVCSKCSHIQTPAPTRQQVSNQNIKNGLGNGFGIALIVVLVMGGLFSGILPLLIGAFLALLVIILPVWFLTNVLMGFLYGNQQGYHDYRKNGGSPFWDNFLGNKTEHNVLPRPEPQYTNFVPAGHWRYQCDTCDSRVENDLNPCWNCGTVLKLSDEQRVDEWLR
jgi:hypothetical protein